MTVDEGIKRPLEWKSPVPRIVFCCLVASLTTCSGNGDGSKTEEKALRAEPHDTLTAKAEREELVAVHLLPRIQDARVLDAMRRVPRHLFVPSQLRAYAYENRPLPIGHGQQISQPLVVALMTELLKLTPKSKVLEIGTGSGYQAAVLQTVAGDVYSIEILEPVAKQGAKNLRAAGYEQVHLRIGDGYQGWSEAAPFDGIIVTCGPDHVPEPLEEQLAEGGRLVIPVGPLGKQTLVLIVKEQGQLRRREVVPVAFVPMTGPGTERRHQQGGTGRINP